MSDEKKPAEAPPLPQAMDPAVVQAKLREVEAKTKEHEKAIGELWAEAALLGSDRQEIAVVMVNGRVSVRGPFHDLVLCYGLLEAGKVAIWEERKKRELAAQAEALAAGGGRTPGGLHIPGAPGVPAPPWVRRGKKS